MKNKIERLSFDSFNSLVYVQKQRSQIVSDFLSRVLVADDQLSNFFVEVLVKIPLLAHILLAFYIKFKFVQLSETSLISIFGRMVIL